MDLTSCTASITSWTAIVRSYLRSVRHMHQHFFQGEDLIDLVPLKGYGSIQVRGLCIVMTFLQALSSPVYSE